MKKTALILAIVALSVFSCQKTEELVHQNQSFLDLPAEPYTYSESGDQVTNHKATLGRVLFYDNHLSINNTVSCGTCHRQANAFADNLALSRGYENRLTHRNTLPIQNLSMNNFTFNNFTFESDMAGMSGSFFWDGRENNLQNLIMRPVTNHIEMGIANAETLPAKIGKLPQYKALFNLAFGSDEITVAKMSEAVSTFLVAITAKQTRFDNYLQTSSGLTALELQGKLLFDTKYPCGSCHNVTPEGYFFPSAFNIGLDQYPSDPGAGAVSNQGSTMNGAFKIPNIRNIALTAPYMHDGRFATLEEVLDHYSEGIADDPALAFQLKDQTTGKPMRMHISDQEKTAIIAFLNTLTDHNMITDPKFSDPFKIVSAH